MFEKRLQTLRDLRRKAEELSNNVASDHKLFEHPQEPHFYFRLPSAPPQKDVVNVTPTCTAWMSLAMSQCLTKHEDREVIKAGFQRLLAEHWDTGGLDENNAFTVAVFARCAAYLKSFGVVEETTLELTRPVEDFDLKNSPRTKIKDEWRKCHEKTIEAILIKFFADPEKSFALDPFPASPAIGYWFIDAAFHLGLDFGSITAFEKWAADEFRRQFSLVAAEHQALMDPVALAMAACTCRSIAKYATKKEYNLIDGFPSQVELVAAINKFLSFQSGSTGVWEKYFPIFQYPKSGPNHCWHFEVLEAIVEEFPELLTGDEGLMRLDDSLEWLKRNRLVFPFDGQTYFGWNAGGDVKAVRRGEPESWPTGVAHMFLARLVIACSVAIRNTILDKFGHRVQGRAIASASHNKWQDAKAWTTKYMDFEYGETLAAECKLGEATSLKKLIQKEILDSALEDFGSTEKVVPNMKLRKRYSAVLFGPPGTAKTTLCKAIAKHLGWPYLELSPSDFLEGGLEGIYTNVTNVFRDLLDLYGVVVLFDEMDALVRTRAAETGDNAAQEEHAKQQDVTQLLLTTSLLPHLARLGEQKRCIYFMATNYIEGFDSAIIRSGRFDLLAQVGPPSSNAKLNAMDNWIDTEVETEVESARNRVLELLKCNEEKFNESDNRSLLDRFTYGETKQFFHSIGLKQQKATVLEAIMDISALDFVTELSDWAQKRITLSDGSPELQRFEKQKKKTQLQ